MNFWSRDRESFLTSEETESIDLGFFDEHEDFSQSIIDELDESFLVADASNLTYALPESVCDFEEEDDDVNAAILSINSSGLIFSGQQKKQFKIFLIIFIIFLKI